MSVSPRPCESSPTTYSRDRERHCAPTTHHVAFLPLLPPTTLLLLLLSWPLYIVAHHPIIRRGWSSWNVFAGSIDEQKILSTIDAMAELASAGYEYVNVDDNWMEKTRDAEGNLQYRKDKFPNGIKVLADHAHSKNLKFGIYSAHGSRTCMGNAASGGPDPHWEQDAKLFASWGVDCESQPPRCC